jgi:hypothetical protein
MPEEDAVPLSSVVVGGVNESVGDVMFCLEHVDNSWFRWPVIL